MKQLILFFTIFLAAIIPGSVFADVQNDCQDLQKIFHTSVESEEGVCAVEMVRKDLKVTHMGKNLSPRTMELVFHFAFERTGNQSAVMGELALLEEEVNPVLEALREGGLVVSALHNHMIHEQPRIMYVHFQGLGDMNQQAKAIKTAINSTKGSIN